MSSSVCIFSLFFAALIVIFLCRMLQNSPLASHESILHEFDYFACLENIWEIYRPAHSLPLNKIYRLFHEFNLWPLIGHFQISLPLIGHKANSHVCMQQPRVASELGDSCSNTFVCNNSGVITQHLLAPCHSRFPWTLVKKYRNTKKAVHTLVQSQHRHLIWRFEVIHL